MVLTYIWHNILFASHYAEKLPGIARMVGDVPTPLFSWFIVAHVIVAVAYAMILPRISNNRGEYAKNGALLGLSTFGFFAILSHALFGGWSTWLMGSDVSFGVVGGLLVGLVLSML